MSNVKLTDLYKQLLACAGMVTDDEGYISVAFNDKNKPALIDGKRLVMPYYNQLASGDEGRTVFHPLRENIMLAESEVVTKFRSVLNIKLNYTFGAIALRLLNIACSPAEQVKLNPYQSEMLSAIGPLGDKAATKFTSIIMNAMNTNPERGFVNIFLRRGGSIKGKKYSRVGAVSFPFMEELNKEQKSYYGAELSKKDRLAYQNLMRYVFPDLDSAEQYYRGSDSEVAPFMDCLMNSVIPVASRLNDVLFLFGDLIDGYKDLVIPADWVETFQQDLSPLLPEIREIPAQGSSEGRRRPNEVVPVTAPVMQTPAQLQLPVQQPPAYQQYQQPSQAAMLPAPIVTERGLDYHSLLRSRPELGGVAMPGTPFMQAPQAPQHLQAWSQFNNAPQQPQYGQQQFFPNQQQPQQFGYIGGGYGNNGVVV